VHSRVGVLEAVRQPLGEIEHCFETPSRFLHSPPAAAVIARIVSRNGRPLTSRNLAKAG
jgi:hypothetical protein